MKAPPLVVFAYNRPDLLARTMAAVRSPAIPVVYAFCDAPKTEADASGVGEVRRLLRTVDWTEVRLIERATNFGLGRSILDGVTTVLREHDSVVILEDDIEFAPGTYDWLAAALEHYADEPRVMSISAWTHPRVTPDGLEGKPFFSGRASCWGWATWARAWKGMPEHTALEFLTIAERAGVRGDRYGADVPALAVVEAERNIWAVRQIAHHMAQHGLALHPGEPYARHIGWDARATHGTEQNVWDAPLAGRAVIPDRWPDVAEHPEVPALWRAANVAAVHSVSSARRRVASVAKRAVRRVQSMVRLVTHAPLALGVIVGVWLMRLTGRYAFEEDRVHGSHPVRIYWHRFLRQHAADVRGRALEVGNTDMVRGIGRAAVRHAEALDVEPRDGVAIVADLQAAWNVPSGQYDVFVNQFSMHIIEDDMAALFHSVRVLRPGGVLLVNFPCVSSHPPNGLTYGSRVAYVQRWYSPALVRRMLSLLNLTGHSHVDVMGSTAGMLAYFAGVPTQLLPATWMSTQDAATPVLICVRVRRPDDWKPHWTPHDTPAGWL